MSNSTPPPVPPSLPPVIPGGQTAPSLPPHAASGISGLTNAELRRALRQGGRVVIFQFCISVLVLSFKRSSPPMLLKPEDNALVKGLPYSLLSFFFGWWGIPWGPIWTIMTLVTNLGGGKDVTPEVMAALGDAQHFSDGSPSSEMPPMREPVPRSGNGLAWAIGGAVLLLFLLGVGWVGYKVVTAGKNLPRDPAQMAFRAADNSIGSSGPSASGNSTEAVRLAGMMSKGMQAFREESFEKAKKKSILDANDTFKTYCQLTEDRCVFLVHVPELRKFTSDAKASLGRAAWGLGQALLSHSDESSTNLQFAVGIRGIASYDRVIIGKHVPNAREDSAGVQRTESGISPERKLYSWFAGPVAGTNSPAISSGPKAVR